MSRWAGPRWFACSPSSRTLICRNGAHISKHMSLCIALLQLLPYLVAIHGKWNKSEQLTVRAVRKYSPRSLLKHLYLYSQIIISFATHACLIHTTRTICQTRPLANELVLTLDQASWTLLRLLPFGLMRLMLTLSNDTGPVHVAFL